MNKALQTPCLMAATVIAVVMTTGLPVLAQPAPPADVAPAPAPRFAVKGFRLIGENPLGDAQAAQLLAPYIRADATLETLQQAATALEAGLRDRGFGLHRVSLPPQSVGDTVQLTIVHFSVASVKVEGAALYDEANILRSLPDLQVGSTPNFKRLAVQTAIANESQGKQIQLSVKESAESDKVDASILVKETRLWNLTAGINNNGSAATGRDRFTVAATHSNLLKLDHQISAAYTTSLEQASSVRQLGLSYRAPFYGLGGVLGAGYTRSDVVGSFGTFTSTGAGQTASINYTHYLVPQKGYRSYVTFGLDDKVFNPSQLNGSTIVGQVVRRSRQLSLSYAARHDADRSLLSYNLDLATNLAGGEGNSLLAYQSEDPRVSKVRWKALRGNVNYVSSLIGNWQWSVRSAVQYSGDALIAGEQFGLGGVASVRGTPERPVAGDRGMSTALEITTPELTSGLRMLGFVDAGWLSNNNANGTSKPANDSLASTGLGLRYGTQWATLGLDYGYVVKGSVVPQTINSIAPKKSDQKLHVNLTAKF